MGLSSKAWAEIYKNFKITRPPGFSGNLNGFMNILVSIKAVGKAISTSPLAKASYNISLALSSTDRGYVPRPPQEVENGEVRGKIKKVWIFPVPIPETNTPVRTKGFYFREVLYPDRIYTLTLRVDVKAGGIPVQGHTVGALDGSSVNFMDKDGVIEWGDVTVIIE